MRNKKVSVLFHTIHAVPVPECPKGCGCLTEAMVGKKGWSKDNHDPLWECPRCYCQFKIMLEIYKDGHSN